MDPTPRLTVQAGRVPLEPTALDPRSERSHRLARLWQAHPRGAGTAESLLLTLITARPQSNAQMTANLAKRWQIATVHPPIPENDQPVEEPVQDRSAGPTWKYLRTQQPPPTRMGFMVTRIGRTVTTVPGPPTHGETRQARRGNGFMEGERRMLAAISQVMARWARMTHASMLFDCGQNYSGMSRGRCCRCGAARRDG